MVDKNIERDKMLSGMVIFCDIDGVLNTNRSLERSTPENVLFDQRAVENLNILLQQSRAELVVHSSWRISLSEHELLSILRKNGVNLATYIGFTPNLPLGMRGEEILLWLEENYRQRDPYLVLDDEDDEIRDKIPDMNFIHINKGFDNRGFSEKFLQIALARLTYL